MKIVVSSRPSKDWNPTSLKPGTLFEWRVEGDEWHLCVKVNDNFIRGVRLDNGMTLSFEFPASDYRPFTGTATISNEEASK